MRTGMNIYRCLELRSLGLLVQFIEMPYLEHCICRRHVLKLSMILTMQTPIVTNIELLLIRFM